MQGIVNDLGQVFVTRPTITVPAVIFLIFVAVRVLTSETLVPKSLPWVGRPTSGPFAETRASFSSFNNVRAWLQEGYATVGECLTQLELSLMKTAVLTKGQVLYLPRLQWKTRDRHSQQQD